MIAHAGANDHALASVPRNTHIHIHNGAEHRTRDKFKMSEGRKLLRLKMIQQQEKEQNLLLAASCLIFAEGSQVEDEDELLCTTIDSPAPFIEYIMIA